MHVIAILSLSVAIQLYAAFLALCMIRTSGGTLAWGALACAILLMAVRRSISLTQSVVAYPLVNQNLQTEVVALFISGLILVGIISIRPLFKKLRQSEKELQDLTWRNKTILETSPDGFCIVEPNGRILEMNKACCEMLGFELNEDTERKFYSQITYPNQTKFRQAWYRIMKAGEGHITVKYEICSAGQASIYVSVYPRCY